MRFWLSAAALAACWPLVGSIGGTVAVRTLGLPPVFLAPLVFASGSLASYVVLWAYFIDPLAGRVTWTALVVANGAWLLARLWRGAEWPRVEREAWVPFALTALMAVACLSYLTWPGVSPPRRFTVSLPLADHLVPHFFADRLSAGIRREPRPLAPLTTFALTTQTSDRPPLQAGVALIARPPWPVSAPTLDTAYQTVATLCQVSVLPALLALATALGLSRRETGFILAAVTCSGFFLINAVYPWPKLYAAALLLTGLAVLVHVTRRGHADNAHAAAIGALASLALLAHGGPVFSLLAAPVLAGRAVVRRLARAQSIASAACAAALLLGPWLAYQRYFDPPGTRLVKIHFAGDLAHDERSLFAAIGDAYRSVDPREWLAGRLANLRLQGLGDWRGTDPVAEIQDAAFFRQLLALDLLAVGLVGLVVQRRRCLPACLSLTALVGYAAFAWVLWMVVMFRGGSATVHHGSYTTTLLFLMGGAVGLAAWGRIGTLLLALHTAGFAAVWLLPRAGIPVFAWKWEAGVLFVSATLGAIACCRWWLRAEPPRITPAVTAPAVAAPARSGDTP